MRPDWAEANSADADTLRKRREFSEAEAAAERQRLREREVRALERLAGIPDGLDP